MTREFHIQKLQAIKWEDLDTEVLATVYGAVAARQPKPALCLDDFAEALYKRHPKKKDKVLVMHALVSVVDQYGMQVLDEIEASHAAWCRTDEWRKGNGSFAPRLADWLKDEGWTSIPAGAQKQGLFSSLMDGGRG